MGANKKKKYPLIQIGELERAHRNVSWSTLLSGFCWSAFAHCFPLCCAGLVDIFHTKPIILEEVKRDVLFYGRDPGSVGNGTAVSPPLTGAMMSPGSKQPFPSFLPDGQAPTSGTRRTPLTRSSAEWHSALQTKSRDKRWDQRNRLSQLPVEESGGPARSSRGRGSGSPDSQRRYYSCHHLILLILFHPALREGVSRETRGGDTPPAFSHMGGGGGTRTPPP